MKINPNTNKRSMFIEGVTEILSIDPLQLRGRLQKTLCGQDVHVSGVYRRKGIYFKFTININTGHILNIQREKEL